MSVELHESIRTVGELQGELTNMVRQYEVIQNEVKRISDTRYNTVKEKETFEQQVVQYQRERQRVNDATAETEKNVARLTKEKLALEYNTGKAEREVLTLRRSIRQLEDSAKESSQKAGSSSDPNPDSVVAKLNSELARANAENSSQQYVQSKN